VHVEKPTEHLLREHSDGVLAEVLCLEDAVKKLPAFADPMQVVHFAVLVAVVEAADVRVIE